MPLVARDHAAAAAAAGNSVNNHGQEPRAAWVVQWGLYLWSWLEILLHLCPGPCVCVWSCCLGLLVLVLMLVPEILVNLVFRALGTVPRIAAHVGYRLAD